jgi:hypothetical protein
MRAFSFAAERVAGLVSSLSWRIVTIVAPKSHVRGLEVAYLEPDADRQNVIQKLEDVFATIDSADGHTWTRIRRHLRRVVVAPAGGPEYLPSIGACLLSSNGVITGSITRLALAIVHEATHARLYAAGIRSDPGRRARIEHVCLRAEENFAAKLPDPVAALAVVHTKMNARPWWTTDRIDIRRERELTALGMPSWFIRAVRLLRGLTSGAKE